MNLDMLLGLQAMNVRVIMIGHPELWKVQVQVCYSRGQLNNINKDIHLILEMVIALHTVMW